MADSPACAEKYLKKRKTKRQKTITAGRRADAFGFAAAGSFVLHQEHNVETLLQRQRPVRGLWKRGSGGEDPELVNASFIVSTLANMRGEALMTLHFNARRGVCLSLYLSCNIAA